MQLVNMPVGFRRTIKDLVWQVQDWLQSNSYYQQVISDYRFDPKNMVNQAALNLLNFKHLSLLPQEICTHFADWLP